MGFRGKRQRNEGSGITRRERNLRGNERAARRRQRNKKGEGVPRYVRKNIETTRRF